MHFPVLTVSLVLSGSYNVLALNRRAPARVTTNILHLKAVSYAPDLMPPSSKHLAQRRLELSPSLLTPVKRQFGDIQTQLVTLGGRVYMTDVTLGGKPFSLVIDTGSSDTWVAASYFQCLNPDSVAPTAPISCGFNASYDPKSSQTWKAIPKFGFSVNYTGGEFLSGKMGTELLGIGDAGIGDGSTLKVNQTIGVVETGYWQGDGLSSGLMGLAYPALVSGAQTLQYNSSMFTLAQADPKSPIFSLALNRPTFANPYGGGYLAIGGIPDIAYDGDFVTVPTVPVAAGYYTGNYVYAWYSLAVNGYDITPPASASTWQKRPPATDPFTAAANVILDSGSSLMYLPDDVADYIARLFVPAATLSLQSGMWIVPCNAVAPRVGVVISGRTFFVSETDLMNKGPGAVGGATMGALAGQCVLGVQRAGGGSLVLGDAWLKNVLVVFDLKRNRIRVAGREVY